MTIEGDKPSGVGANVGVVGAGHWGRNIVRNFHELDALVGFCESNEARRSEFNRLYPDVAHYESLSDLIENGEASAIAIATPATTHASLVREALEADKDVFVEKPLALTAAEGEELVSFAELRGRVLMVGHLLWYHPAVRKLKELVDSGELGRIQYIYSNRLNLGKIRTEENILWSFAPHDVSVIIGLLGEEPDAVVAQGGHYLRNDVADVTVSLLGFPSGVKAHIFVSWLHPFKEQRMVVIGDRKMAVFADTDADKLTIYPHSIEWKNRIPVPNKADARAVPIDTYEPLRAECRHFLECLKTRQRPVTDGNEGLRVLRVLERCQHALEDGRERRRAATFL